VITGGGAEHAVAFDNADPAVVVAGVEQVEEVAVPLDILVCNTGAQHRRTFLDLARHARRVVTGRVPSRPGGHVASAARFGRAQQKRTGARPIWHHASRSASGRAGWSHAAQAEADRLAVRAARRQPVRFG
jgi:NAD(P)-dependent dehydrogenase (short-subunit alcohol dehydrogenase family)